jgi:hypothetical protein
MANYHLLKSAERNEDESNQGKILWQASVHIGSLKRSDAKCWMSWRADIFLVMEI